MRLVKIHTGPPELIFTLSALSSRALYHLLPQVPYNIETSPKTRPDRTAADDGDDDAF